MIVVVVLLLLSLINNNYRQMGIVKTYSIAKWIMCIVQIVWWFSYGVFICNFPRRSARIQHKISWIGEMAKSIWYETLFYGDGKMFKNSILAINSLLKWNILKMEKKSTDFEINDIFFTEYFIRSNGEIQF